MERALGLTTLIVSLVLLWSRTRRLRFSSLAATVLTGLELLAVGFAVASLGWWGVVALGLVNVLAVLIWLMMPREWNRSSYTQRLGPTSLGRR